jgi:hypothetical protein
VIPEPDNVAQGYGAPMATPDRSKPARRSRHRLTWSNLSPIEVLIRRILPIAVITYVLAVMGYTRYLPSAPISDSMFYALNLMTLNFYSLARRSTCRCCSTSLDTPPMPLPAPRSSWPWRR